jgi:hypothetical protein
MPGQVAAATDDKATNALRRVMGVFMVCLFLEVDGK